MHFIPKAWQVAPCRKPVIRQSSDLHQACFGSCRCPQAFEQLAARYPGQRFKLADVVRQAGIIPTAREVAGDAGGEADGFDSRVILEAVIEQLDEQIGQAPGFDQAELQLRGGDAKHLTLGDRRAQAAIGELQGIDLPGQRRGVNPADNFGGLVEQGGDGDFLHIEVVAQDGEGAREAGGAAGAADHPQHAEQGAWMLGEQVFHDVRFGKKAQKRVDADHHHRTFDGVDVGVPAGAAMGLQVHQQAHGEQRIAEHDAAQRLGRGLLGLGAQLIEFARSLAQHRQGAVGKVGNVGFDRGQRGKQRFHGGGQKSAGWRGLAGIMRRNRRCCNCRRARHWRYNPAKFVYTLSASAVSACPATPPAPYRGNIVTAFKAFVIDQDAERKLFAGMRDMEPAELDQGEVDIRVRYSSINYKDALAATGAGKIIRRFPCVGGIDLAGEVIASADPRFKPGDPVVATSFDLGVAHHGGYAERARVPAQWVLPLPAGLDLFEAMALGTAGFTAALGIVRMEDNGLAPGNGPVLVTGATGGVGALAIDMLARLGYHVVALTGKPEESDYLHGLGAAEIKLRSEIDFDKVRPLEAGLWAGAVDNVGGQILHWVLATMQQAGTVASIGNAASFNVNTTVFPFILRGVSLLGIDSGYIGFPTRQRVWDRLASDLKPRHLHEITRTIEFGQLPAAFDDFIAGKVKGRTVVRVSN